MVLALVLAACGGSSGSKSSSGGSSGGSGGGEGKPVSGGTIKYALEGATTAFCPPTGQWAIAGIMVAQSIYDTLTRPTDNPEVYAPYLASSITPNADYTQWTIVNREGVKFQDGEALTADVIKQNIDAWRKGILLGFVFSNISDVAVTGPNTTVVTTKVPWVAFPAFLWSTGRTAIAAPAQLNNSATCDTNMIGTGPFKLKSFDPATGQVSVVKNPDYWQKGYPYLDGIDFIPQAESSQRVSGLQGGQFDVIQDSGGKDLDAVKAISGTTTVEEPNGRMEISHALPNVSVAPFNDLNARKAIAMGINAETISAIVNKGTGRLTEQVFDTRVMGYVTDPGFPKYNPAAAKKLVSQYKASHGGKFEFDLQSTFDQTTQQQAAEVKRELAQVGITVNLPAPVDQATIINEAIGGTVDSFLWRNYPGADPDTLYVWFYGGSTVNFNHLDDPQINQALDAGRSETDTAKRTADYEAFNKRMSSQVYNLWSYYTQWFVGTKSNVHGIVGPNLPNAQGQPGTVKPVAMLAGYHQLLGMWKS